MCCNLQKAQGGRLNAIRNGNPTCDFQVATDRASSDPVRGPLVLAVFVVAAGCGGTAGGTRAGSGSYDRVALGTALFARTGTAAATAPQADQQILARGRDLCSSEGPLVLPVSGHRFCRSHIDFLLSAFRDADAAKRLFRQALSHPSHPQPRVINTDLAPIYGSAIPDIKKDGILRRRCRHRPVQYLNNILEQDHRAIKRRVKPSRASENSGRRSERFRVMKR